MGPIYRHNDLLFDSLFIPGRRNGLFYHMGIIEGEKMEIPYYQ